MSDDRVFLITGASSGIGAATARAAAQAGHRLVLAARSSDRLQALADELGGSERAIAVTCDVTDYAAQEAMVASAVSAFGGLDIVFANAGFGGARNLGTDSTDSPERWREMVLTNVLGPAYTIRACLAAVTAARGHILLTGSVVGRRPVPGSFYSATKWAITGLAEALRLQVSATGVRVTLIEPGMTDTPFFDNRPANALAPEDLARAVMYAVSQPAHVDVGELLVRPTGQAL
ncbi:MAG: SDR family oxidoreductase [Solirubrobacteraceae bacterium]|jgi:NADP-dependent 3-hydroxy acid dehydrogenase YdfG